ncbi:hypothetical protein FRB91_004408 [Serendipita sp. 411]|nr:hypothetical protein FRB91_004408 [Serendipita sp. 411]
MLEGRFCSHGRLENLENAILNYEKAIKYAEPSHYACRSKFYQRLEDALTLHHERAVKFPLNDQTNAPAHHYKLGDVLLERFERFGELEGLDSAISNLQKSVDLTPEGHPDKKRFRNRLRYGMEKKAHIEGERIEEERIETEYIKMELIEKELTEKKRIKKEHIEKERIEKARIEKARIERERIERERIERERTEKERIERERTEKECAEREHTEKGRIGKAVRRPENGRPVKKQFRSRFGYGFRKKTRIEKAGPIRA